MGSQLLLGRVTHTRVVPHRHHLAYRLALFDLDLDTLEDELKAKRLLSFERANWIGFRRRDFFGERETPLKQAVLDRVQAELGFRPDGRVRLVTQLRTLGYAFNPVSFYLCENAAGRVQVILAEITNTPWSERFAYVLDAREQTGDTLVFHFDKAFHVSPFFDMDQQYEWRFTCKPASLGVHMTNREQGQVVFHAGYDGQATPLDQVNLASYLLRYPFQPLRMHAAIYWHAAKLYIKRTPFFTHPKKRPAQASN